MEKMCKTISGDEYFTKSTYEIMTQKMDCAADSFIKLSDIYRNCASQIKKEKSDDYWSSRILSEKIACAEQFGNMAEYMKKLRGSMMPDLGCRQETEQVIRKVLKKEKIQLKGLSVYGARKKGMQIYMKAAGRVGCETSVYRLASELGEAMGISLVPCDVYKRIVPYEDVEILFREDTDFYALTGVAGAPKSNVNVSGDNFSFLYRDNGEFVMTLSDGMGSGEKASKESETSINIIEELIGAGFEEQSAIKLMNSVLSMREDANIYSTVDMSIIDLFTGMCRFIKLGGASTYVKHNKNVDIIESGSLPVGILNETACESYMLRLYDGDYIIMLSDGVSECFGTDSGKVLKKMISGLKECDPKLMARKILNIALAHYDGRPQDDMTVLVCCLHEKTKG